jgi:hypothetical protein
MTSRNDFRQSGPFCFYQSTLSFTVNCQLLLEEALGAKYCFTPIFCKDLQLLSTVSVRFNITDEIFDDCSRFLSLPSIDIRQCAFKKLG